MGGGGADRGRGHSDGRPAEPVPSSDGTRDRSPAGALPPRRPDGDSGRLPNPGSRVATMIGSFNAIVPMACVTAAALAAMVAEAFRDPGERMPIGPLGAIGLVGAAIASAMLWNNNSSSFGV